MKRWPIPVDGFPALEPGIERIFRKGRAALLARKRPGPENFHNWRKRVKDHWYHVRLLEDLWTEWMQGYEASLKDAETWLGDDHNLVILRELLIREPGLFGKSIELVVDRIGRQQRKLRTNAESLGERIYREKPGIWRGPCGGSGQSGNPNRRAWKNSRKRSWKTVSC